MNYPTIEDAIGRTPLVALQRIGAATTERIRQQKNPPCVRMRVC